MNVTKRVRGQPCYLRIAVPCDDETVVPCHLPSKAMKGVAMKTPDVFAVPGCRRCHDIIDRRGNEWRDWQPKLVEKRMRLALMEWIRHLMDEGFLVENDSNGNCNAEAS